MADDPFQAGGKDRLYVNNADGTALGYLDRHTGATHVDRPEDEARVAQALRHHGTSAAP